MKVKTTVKADGTHFNYNETLVRAKGIKVKTQVKAGVHGTDDYQHNETLVRDQVQAKGLKVKSHIKAGRILSNHNETLVRDQTKGIKVKTQVKAGGSKFNHNETLVREQAKGKRLTMSVKVDRLRRKIEAEGFTSPIDDKAIVQMAYGLRLAPALCMTWAATGTVLASSTILWALVPLAILGALLPNHPFDALYNFGLRHLIGAAPLPRYPLTRRLVCVMAVMMLLLAGWGFQASLPMVGYFFGGQMAAVALIYSTTGFCLASFSLQPRRYMRCLNQ